MKLTKIDDLKPDPRNPRKIGQDAMYGLKKSIGAFGDLSGLTWNARTGHLVAGHQRLTALRTLYGDNLLFDAVVPCLVAPTGERFRWNATRSRPGSRLRRIGPQRSDPRDQVLAP